MMKKAIAVGGPILALICFWVLSLPSYRAYVSNSLGWDSIWPWLFVLFGIAGVTLGFTFGVFVALQNRKMRWLLPSVLSLFAMFFLADTISYVFRLIAQPWH